jgi:hypothetical protein
VALFVEVTYESAAGLRADWEAQLKAGKLAVPGSFADEPAPFADVTVVLMVAGAEAARAPALLITAGGDATQIEIVPEGRAPLSSLLTALLEGAPASGSLEGRRVRLYDDAKPPSLDEPEARAEFENAPTAKHRASPGGSAQPLDRKIAALSVGEKVRLAVHGSRDERALLAKDRAGIVQASLVRNPRITIDEVLALARAPHLSPDAAEAMVEHPSYGASAQIALALVRNPRTPIPLAVDLLGKLQVHDLRVIAKGLNVRMPIAQAARRKLQG